MVVTSISGIRGIVNDDLGVQDLIPPVLRFAAENPSREFLIGRDTRRTGPMIQKAIIGALTSNGVDVVDYGVLSTPALFRESRTKSVPAVMVSASHNEPEWNGIKFMTNGQGITQGVLDKVIGAGESEMKSTFDGTLKSRRSAYNSELIARGGVGSCEGVSAVLDLNGSAAINHAPVILSGVGCKLNLLGDTEGIFTRTVDPTADDLTLLGKTVKREGWDVGFAFDCDGDRLVLVDGEGEKKAGDFMLTLAIKRILPSLENKNVVVSVDTTQAVDEVVTSMKGKVFRSKVGEANVVSKLLETECTLGGEGSSGGLIDGSYNYCRDSMLAAIAIAKGIAKEGSRVFKQVPSYQLVRLKVPMDRKKALAAMKKLVKQNPDADITDGLKLKPSSHSWVLIRVSGTEDAVRVSAESRSHSDAQELAGSYLKRVKDLG